MSNTSTTYTCECGSVIKKRGITAHNKTKKHISFLNNKQDNKENMTQTDPQEQRQKARDKLRENWKKYVEHRKSEDYDQWKRDQALKKWKQRNPNKDVSEYKPRARTQVRKTESKDHPVVHKLVKSDPLPDIQKITKEKVEKQTIDHKNITNRDSLIAALAKASNQRDKAKASNTAEINVNRVGNLYKYMNDSEWDYRSFDWLKDTDKILNFVRKRKEWKTEKTRSNQFVSIAGILKYMPEYKTEFGIYSKLGSNIVDKLDRDTKDNKLSEARKLVVLRWDKVLSIDLSDNNGGNSFLRALYSIYTKIPPRRALDYRLMKIVRKDKLGKGGINKLDRKYNYVFINKSKRPSNMIIYNYKEAPRQSWRKKKGSSYGEYSADIPPDLAVILQEYIIDENLVGGDFLFGLDSNHKKHYQDGAFSSLVSKNIFNTFLGASMTINDLRKSYVSWHLNHLKTYNEKEQLAYQMGSSIEELSKTYYKVDLDKPSGAASLRFG